MPICSDCDTAYFESERHVCAPRQRWWADDSANARTPPTRRVIVAYLLAPIGAAVVAFVVEAYVYLSAAMRPPRFTLTPLLGFVMSGVLIAYVVGLVLLPAFWMFARMGRLGLRSYLPTAALAGLFVAVSSSNAWQYYLLCTVAGSACAVVFAFVLAARRVDH